jgi:hypothetical protein
MFMAYEFVIDTAANIIRETWTGRVDLAQLKQSSREEWEHPDYRKNMNMIVDFRQAKMDITADDVWEFATWFNQRESLTKLATVVSREVGFGMLRMFASISTASGGGVNDNNVRIFYSLAAAEAWIASDGALT